MRPYKLGVYEKAMPEFLSWEERLTAAKEADYDFVEFSIDETDRRLSRLYMLQEEKASLKQAVRESGLPLGSICLSAHRKYPLGSSDAQTEKKGLEILERAVDFAAEFGIRMIQLAGYDVYYESSGPDTKKRFEYNLFKGAEMAAEAGVILGFETMETDFMNTTAKAMYFVNRIRSPYLQVYPDVGNITNAVNGSAAEAVKDLKQGSGHLTALHLKETLPGRFREVPFGEGHVNFEYMTREAYYLGVRRFLAEFWYLEGMDWKQELGRVNRHLRKEFHKFL